MRSLRTGFVSTLVGVALALVAAPVLAAETADADAATTAARDEPATLRLVNRDIVTLRARVAGATPQIRVHRVGERLQAMPTSALDEPLSRVPFRFADGKGVQFTLGDRLLVAVVEGDADPDSKQSFDALVEQTRGRLEEVRAAYHEAREPRLLLQGVLRTVAATAALGLLIWATYRSGRKAVEWMEKKRDVLAARFPYVDWREFLARLAVGTMQLVQWFVLLALAYVWVYFVLGSFIATSPIAQHLGDWLWGRVVWLSEGALDSLPGLVTVVIVLVLTRAVADLIGYLLDAVQKGRLRLPWFHPETIVATRRIFSLVVWALGIAIAYPFLPGSSSETFKGVSVLVGVMVTLGSSGIVTQAMSGLVLIYSRALHKGDFVDINGVQGVVTEVASLATKVVNVRNEEVTIPNSVVIANPIHNYSKLAGSQGTLLTSKVTIGYDAPWRQIHALLIGAAQVTTGVRSEPVPYVYQRALSDFYVEYELFFAIDAPRERVAILSALHANIQDAFNEHGVQIMSPHFFAQPQQAVVVSKDQWYAAPARRP